MPFQSTPLCSANRLSSIETIANFIVLAILSLGTSKRRWVYSQAMGAPLMSTIVDTAGTSPSTSWAEPLATTSDARLDSRPKPPAMGNISAAAITAVNRTHQANLITVTVIGGGGVGRSDMGNRVATSLVGGPGVPGLAGERGLRFRGDARRWITARLSQKKQF